jgi:hypothetical protein
MTYLHEGLVFEAQHVSTSKGSSSGAEYIPNMNPYCRASLYFHIEHVTRYAQLKLELID